MLLKDLCRDLPVKMGGGGETEILRLTLDSRTAGPNCLYAAAMDPMRDGESFLPDALNRGAAAVLAGREVATSGVPLIVARDLRRTLGEMAHRLEGEPTRGLLMAATTGTNGKTTYTYLLEKIFADADLAPGVVGTIDYRFAGQVRRAPNTTPEAPELASLLREMKDAGAQSVVMEVSSHGAELARIAGIRFTAAAFMNLGRDHLDFHLNEENYLRAKCLLFSEYLDPAGVAVINADDPSAKRVAASSKAHVVTYGISPDATYRIESLAADHRGVRMRLRGPGTDLVLESPLIGRFQAHNIAAAAVTALEVGIVADIIAEAIRTMPLVPGRMERVPDEEVLALVDYAHTPGAVTSAVAATRELTAGRLITVVGCGGDRDKGKRPLMGRAAAAGSDIVILTSDNPRTEDPLAIIEDILAGLDLSAADRLSSEDVGFYRGIRGLLVEADRRRAIQAAINGARPGDAVLIVGKGHEDYQIIGRTKIHLDDREEAKAALLKRSENRRKADEAAE